MTDEDRLLEKRLAELAQRCYSNCCYTSSEFLDLSQQDVFSHVSGNMKHVPARLLGGHEACERRIAFFGSEELCGYVQEPPIACVSVRPKSAKFSGELTHRDFLGSIMGLGIKRETVGDIFLSDGGAFVFCLDHIAPYIEQNLVSVGRTTVVCSVSEGVPEELTVKTEREMINVASERLDAVVGGAYNLSRGAVSELIEEKRVFVNSRLSESGSACLRTGDIVSVRGRGRFVFLGTEGMSKKGRLFVLIEKYV